jgi:hypothetical protein
MFSRTVAKNGRGALWRASTGTGSGLTARAGISSSVHALRNLRPSIAAAAPALLPSALSNSRGMATHHGESTLRPEPDKVLQDIADYVHNYKIESELALETARLCLIDTVGCGLEGLRFPECAKLLGPVVEGTIVPNGTLHWLLNIPTDAICVFWSLQEPRSPVPTTSWILSEVLSTLELSSAGLTTMIASWLPNVRPR